MSYLVDSLVALIGLLSVLEEDDDQEDQNHQRAILLHAVMLWGIRKARGAGSCGYAPTLDSDSGLTLVANPCNPADWTLETIFFFRKKIKGPNPGLNRRPPAPKAGIIPLDHSGC